jgi:hypothetical protein
MENHRDACFCVTSSGCGERFWLSLSIAGDGLPKPCVLLVTDGAGRVHARACPLYFPLQFTNALSGLGRRHVPNLVRTGR